MAKLAHHPLSRRVRAHTFSHSAAQPRNKEPVYMPCSIAVLHLLLMLMMIAKQTRCTNHTPLGSRTMDMTCQQHTRKTDK